jgi:hypothetical protein
LSVEVWCRYFPDVYTDGSGNQITPTSYDYRSLYVQAGSVTMRKKVSTAWGKYRFSIINNSVGLRILRISADDNIEISKVSLKYK